MSHFNVSLIVSAKSQDSVHKPQFLKRKESRSGLNRGPSAYQPSALVASSSLVRILGECSTTHSPSAFSFLLLPVEITSRTLIPLPRPESDYSGAVSLDDCV